MIRSTTPADADSLAAIAEGTGLFKPIEIAGLRETLADLTGHDNHAVAFDENGVILGFAIYGHVPMTDRTWQLRWLAVRKDRQGRGIGADLLRFVEHDIRDIQQGRVIFVDTGSPPAYDLTRRFYAKHGYTQQALVQDFWADGDSLVVFRKALLAGRASDGRRGSP